MARVRSRKTLRRRSKTAPRRRRRRTRRTRGRKITLRRKTSKKKNPKRRSMKRKIMRGGAPDVKVYVNGNWVPAHSYQEEAFSNFKMGGPVSAGGVTILDNRPAGTYIIEDDGTRHPIADWDDLKIFRTNGAEDGGDNTWWSARPYQKTAYYDYNYGLGGAGLGGAGMTATIVTVNSTRYTASGIDMILKKTQSGRVFYERNEGPFRGTRVRISDDLQYQSGYQNFVNHMTATTAADTGEMLVDLSNPEEAAAVAAAVAAATAGAGGRPSLPPGITTKDYDGDNDEMLCFICATKEKNIVFRPCGHDIVCSDCYPKLNPGTNLECPICRGSINNVEPLTPPVSAAGPGGHAGAHSQWFTGSDNLIVDESGNALVKGDHGDTRLVRISGLRLDPAIVADPFQNPPPYPGLTIVNREAEGSEVMKEIQNPDVPKTTRQLFVLPSQLNGAEYPSPDHIVSHVEHYKPDQTAGPRGQLACDNNVAQVIINNASNDNNPNGINYVRDVIEDGDKITLKNGYLMIPGDTTDGDVQHFSDNLHKMECLASADIPVTGYNPGQTATSIVKIGGMGLGKHKIKKQVKKVDLTYTSAIPLGVYGNSKNEKVKKIAQLVIYAQYVCSLKFACEQAAGYENYQVNLIPLGGGVFNNPRGEIVKAILHAINTVRGLPNFDKLEIRLLLWDGQNADGGKIRPSEVTEHSADGIQLPYSEILDTMNSYIPPELEPEPEPEPQPSAPPGLEPEPEPQPSAPPPSQVSPRQGTLINDDPQFKTVGYLIEEWGIDDILPNDTSVTVIRAGPQKDGDNTYIVKTSDEGPEMIIKEKHVKLN